MIEVSTLTGPLLDYWAGKANGENVGLEQFLTMPPQPCAVWLMGANGRPDFTKGEYSPSTNWAQGGPIMEREGISVEIVDKQPIRWMAVKPHETSNFQEDYYYGYGGTYLETAIRCFVASKFGPQVEELKL